MNDNSSCLSIRNGVVVSSPPLRCGPCWAKKHSATARCSERDAKKILLLAMNLCTICAGRACLYTNYSASNKYELFHVNGNVYYKCVCQSLACQLSRKLPISNTNSIKYITRSDPPFVVRAMRVCERRDKQATILVFCLLLL